MDHSLSPLLHQAAIKAAGLQGTYQRFPIPPHGHPGESAPRKLLELLDEMRQGNIQGLNVTIPYKNMVSQFIDVKSNTVQQIGAVNTIALRSGNLVGENTDYAGFLNDLQRLGFAVPAHKNDTALVLGAGGAARAVVNALLERGWRVCIIARRPEQSKKLVENVKRGRKNLFACAPQKSSFLQPFGLLINTTPLGMPPLQNENPWPDGIPLPSQANVYDLVYHGETPLIKAARAAGLEAAGGVGMLIEQAALSFEIWTGCAVPRQALIEALQSQTIV